MTEQEINQKLEQANTDKTSIEANIAELEKQKANLSKKWILAKSDDRFILNLSALSEGLRLRINEGLGRNLEWVSFRNNGDKSAFSNTQNGLTFYSNTEIIFGENTGRE